VHESGNRAIRPAGQVSCRLRAALPACCGFITDERLALEDQAWGSWRKAAGGVAERLLPPRPSASSSKFTPWFTDRIFVYLEYDGNRAAHSEAHVAALKDSVCTPLPRRRRADPLFDIRTHCSRVTITHDAGAAAVVGGRWTARIGQWFK